MSLAAAAAAVGCCGWRLRLAAAAAAGCCCWLLLAAVLQTTDRSVWLPCLHTLAVATGI